MENSSLKRILENLFLRKNDWDRKRFIIVLNFNRFKLWLLLFNFKFLNQYSVKVLIRLGSCTAGFIRYVTLYTERMKLLRRKSNLSMLGFKPRSSGSHCWLCDWDAIDRSAILKTEILEMFNWCCVSLGKCSGTVGRAAVFLTRVP